MKNDEDKKPIPARPPLAVDALVAVLQGHRGDWPEAMPLGPADAARWWMQMQEPARDVESPERSRRGWKAPYVDRLVFSLLVFLSLDPDFQRLIRAAREDRIWWRGECFSVFTRVIEEVEKMRDVGVDAYRRSAADAVRSFVGQSVVGDR